MSTVLEDQVFVLKIVVWIHSEQTYTPKLIPAAHQSS